MTNALTHGLSIAADLFVDKGDTVVVPNKFWGNYNLTFGLRRKGNIVTFDLFNEQNKFNTEGLKEAIFQAPGQKMIVVLNFPNNPTGYTPTEEEAETIIAVLKEAAKEKCFENARKTTQNQDYIPIPNANTYFERILHD